MAQANFPDARLVPLLALLAIVACTDAARPGADPAAGGSSGASGAVSGAAGATLGGTGTAGSNTQSGEGNLAGASNAGGTNAAGSSGSAGSSSTSGGSAGANASAGAVGNAGASGSAGAAGSSGAGGAPNIDSPWSPVFETVTLSTSFYSEGAQIADLDQDGVLDLVAGPRWYRGPDFQLGGELIDPPSLTRDQYSTFFLVFVDDLNDDGYPDVIAIGDAGGGNGSGNPNAHWYENPAPPAPGASWAKHALFDGLVSNESPAYVDLVGDARKELVFMTNRQLGYATPGASPTAPWTFTAVSGNVFNTPYVHGLGVGDVDGDGLDDIVERGGWWKQPTNLGGLWERHMVDFGSPLGESRPNNWGGSQMHVADLDGDGDSDIVTSLSAHRYGLVWYEQTAANTFEAHEILPIVAGSGNISQLHAVSVADLNGDGLLDLVTGKRYYAHPSSNPDPGTEEPAEIRWFELNRNASGTSFTSHVIHAASGVGCNFAIGDVNADGRPDLFVANKRGVFLHRQQ